MDINSTEEPDGIVDYIWLHSGATVSYSFTVPAGNAETLTYGIPAGGYLNNAASSVSIDGSSPVTVNSNLRGFGATASSDLYLWTSSALSPGTHTWTITSQGDAVNVYGLWLAAAAASTPTCWTTNGQEDLTLYPNGVYQSNESGLAVTIDGVVIAPEGTLLTGIDWNWGDGTIQTGCVYFPQSHTYQEAGTYNVVVTTTFTDGTQLQASEDVTVSGSTAPTVTNVKPDSGPTMGGTPVTIKGTGFSTASRATVLDFGSSNPATGVSCSSSTTCTATSPAGTGTVDVTTTVAGRTSSVNPPDDQFTYTTSVINTPGAPTDVNATPGDSSAKLSWSVPSSQGGAPITSYTITPSPPCPSCSGLSVSGSPPSTSTTVDGLTNGRTYTFTVTATNSAGSGRGSAASNPVTPQSCVTSVNFGLYEAIAESGSCLEQNGDIYTDTGPIRLNGLEFVPKSGMVKIDTSAQQLYADNASVMVGQFLVYSGLIPTTNLALSFGLGINDDDSIGDLPLSGPTLEVDVTSEGELTLTVAVNLPAGLGSKAGASITAILDNSVGLESVVVDASDIEIPVGVEQVGLQELSLEYDPPTNTWQGSAQVALPSPDAPVVAGSITITDGQVTQFSIGGSNLDLPLGPDGVFLDSIAADIGILPPSYVTGTGEISAGPEIEGESAADIQGSLNYTFSNPGELSLSGTLSIVGETLVSGYLDYYANGQLTMGGVFSASFGIASLDVGLNGWIDGLTAFSLSGTGSLGLGPYSMNGEAEVSNIGVVACGQPFGSLGASVGFGYLWGGAVTVLYDSCDLGPYTPQESDAVSQSPATFPHAWGDAISSQVAVEIPSGLRVVSFAIKGTDGLPRGTLRDPQGHILMVNPAKQGAFTSSMPEYVMVVGSTLRTDYIAINSPAGGTWTFTAARGLSVSSIRTADGLPSPSVSAKVSGHGPVRVLTWRMKSLPGQSVTFVEQGKKVDHVLATDVTATSGRLSFTSANGSAGTRVILAMVMQHRLPRTVLRVASYSASATESIVVTVRKRSGASGAVVSSPTGILCGSVCSATFLEGETVKLMPRPTSGSVFLGWTEGVCSGTHTCEVKLTQEVDVTALFGPKKGPHSSVSDGNSMIAERPASLNPNFRALGIDQVRVLRSPATPVQTTRHSEVNNG
ncbi:MAG: fibronectin type III domain-containing protein [Acidimicrobiales bacterium]